MRIKMNTKDQLERYIKEDKEDLSSDQLEKYIQEDKVIRDLLIQQSIITNSISVYEVCNTG